MHINYRLPLSRPAAAELMRLIIDQNQSEAFIVDVLTQYHQRGVTVDEVLGFLDTLRDSAISVDLGTDRVVDLCGTGGDGKNTFNISTTVAFIVAGSGFPVAKHGNSAFSSSAGSSDVLRGLGVPLYGEPGQLKRTLEECGVCFLHAPFFHPALRGLASVRKKLGHKTIFNTLGPLLNPANPKVQCLGVSSFELIDIYSNVLLSLGTDFCVLHSQDGYDEISLTGEFIIATPEARTIYTPEQLGFSRHRPEELCAPNSLAAATETIETILRNGGTSAQADVVIANAGFAIHTFDPEISLHDAFGRARESLEGLHAYRVLEKLRSFKEVVSL